MAKLGDQLSQPTKLGSLVKSARHIRKSVAAGSYEDHQKHITPFVIEASGCENAPEAESSDGSMAAAPAKADGSYPHYCSVIATFPDYALVECMDEDKVWKVPYDRDGDAVTCGEPEEMKDVFVPVGADDEEDDDEGSPEV
jgi:hypothetical protein